MILPWDFPGGPVVETLPSSAGVVGSIPDLGAKIPHSLQTKILTTAAITTKKKKTRGNIVTNSIRL